MQASATSTTSEDMNEQQEDIHNTDTALREDCDNTSSIQDPMIIKNKGRPPNPKRFKTLVEMERQKIQKENN